MRHIFTDKAPTPGAYSQGVLVDPRNKDILFLAGQTGNDKEQKDEPVVEGGVGPQTTQALNNLLAVVQAAGGTARSFVKLNVYLKDSGSEDQRQTDWHAYNLAYKNFFAEQGVNDKELPARKQLWVSDVPWATEPTLVEIDGFAAI
jgi:2-iminobutanoate/2-iminopropanoate deaminase